jgi:hypothetical protein
VQVTFLTKPELSTSSLGHLLSLLVHLQAERTLKEGTLGSGSPPSLGSVTRQEKIKSLRFREGLGMLEWWSSLLLCLLWVGSASASGPGLAKGVNIPFLHWSMSQLAEHLPGRHEAYA